MNEIREVGVMDVLRARDARAARQQEMLKKHGLPLISFTMNIAGPVKTDGLIRRAFFEGVARIEAVLTARRIGICDRVQTLEFTGNEQLWAVDADASALKDWMRAIEEEHPLGRLFDIDVLDANGAKLSRDGHRKCLICGGDVHVCGRSRAHSAQELFLRAREMMQAFFDGEYARFIGMCAQRALLYEAVTSPKPGLVDAENNGAHRDMNLFTFMASASALRGWFEQAARTGMMGLSGEETFARLRVEGVRAEEEMLCATENVNTHKGALFSLGVACCAAGRMGEGAAVEEILECAARIAKPALNDYDGLNPEKAATGGEKQYIESGLTGIRGEAAAGFPSVRKWGLPALEAALERGESVNDAGLHALIALMARVPDSNILRRRGRDALENVQARARELAETGFTHDGLRRMNDDFVRENISPGGSADLLALTYFLYLITKDNGGITRERNP